MAQANLTKTMVDRPLNAAITDTSVNDALPQSGYLTVEWVKRHYSISASTLYKWVADSRNGGGNGFPAPVKIGPRATRFAVDDLRRFEASLSRTKADA